MVDALAGHTAAQNTLGSEGLRDGDSLSSSTLSNILQGLRGNGIVRLQDTAYGSTRNAVNTQPGAVTRATTNTLTVQGGYIVLDGMLYEFAGGPGGSATVTIGTHGTGTALAAAGEQSMYVVYIASQGGQAKIHADGGAPVQTSTGLYPQLPTQFLVDYDTGGSIANDQVLALATLRCSYSAGGGTHKVDVQEVNDKRTFTRSNPIYMTPISSGTIVTDGSELSQISRAAAEGVNTASELNALFSGAEVGVFGGATNGATKIDVGALWMSTGKSGASLGYGPGDGLDRGSNRMMDDLFFAGQENSEVGVVTKRLFAEGVSAPTGNLSTASYTIKSQGDKWFIFAPANGATITLNPEKSGSVYLFPEGHMIEVCNNGAANGGNIVFDTTGLNTTLTPDQRATFIYEGSLWLRCDYQAAISTLSFVTLTDTPSSLGSPHQFLKVNSGGTALEFVTHAQLTTEEVQDIVGGMVTGNTETNIAVTYEDGDGTLDFVSTDTNTQLSTEQVQDIAGPLVATGGTKTFIAVTYDDANGNMDLVVPVLDEDNMATNSATNLATQQSIKAYVDTEVSNLIDSAPGALNTLNELAAALGDDANYAATTTTALGTKLVKTANLSDLANAGTARTNLGLGSMAVLSAIDISSHTNLAVSAPIVLTGDTLSIANIPFSALHADAVQISSESFADNDTSLMTSASIQDKILAYGYSTTTGTVTSVATGTGLTGGTITGSGTLALSHLGIESLADPNADRIMFWDDSAGAMAFLTAGTNLTITDTTIAATDTNTQLSSEQVQDIVGAMFTSNTETRVAVTYQDGDGTIDVVVDDLNTVLTQAQVRDYAGGMFTGNTETFITATYQTGDDTVDLVVPVLDENDMATDSDVHLATQQSIKKYVDDEVAGIVDTAPAALNTLNELAAALGDDANYAATTTTALGTKLVKSANLSDLTNAGTARTNLGLGAMALLGSIDISSHTNLAVGTGLDLTGDTLTADVSDFLTNGSDNRVVTATGADAMNAEANLTFDGSLLEATGGGNTDIKVKSTSDGRASFIIDGYKTSDAAFGQIAASNNTDSVASIGFNREGANDAGAISFNTQTTSTTTVAERMRITSAGNVGIGITAPVPMLHVKADNGTTDMNSAGAASITIEQDGAGDAAFSMLLSGTRRWMMGIDNSDSDKLKFATGGTSVDSGTVMTVDVSGNVGIGETTPAAPLEVRKVSTGQTTLLMVKADADSGDQSASMTADIDFHLWDQNTQLTTPQARIGVVGDSTASQNSEAGGRLAFYTNIENYASPSLVERMRIMPDGKVGINDTSPSYTLDVDGDINLTGTLRVGGTAQTTADAANNATITLAAGTGLSTGGDFTTNQSGNETITFNVAGLTVSELAANSLQISSESFADNDTSLMTSAAIQDKILAYGYTTNTGDITGVTAGVGLSGGGSSGGVTLTLDMSELTDMTQAVNSAQDELIILDNGADKRKLISEIPLSAFNDDLATTSGTQLNATDDRDLAPEDLSYANDFQVFFTSKEGLEDGSTIGGNYMDALVMNTWSDASGHDANVLAFDKSTMAIYHYQADQAATNWGTAKQLAYTTGGASDDFHLKTTAGVRFYDADDSHYTQIEAHATTTTSETYKLPAADGTNGHQLTTDGSGNLSWAAPGGAGNVSISGTPADNQFAIWTDASTIEGSGTGLTWTDATDTLKIDSNQTDPATDTPTSFAIHIDHDSSGSGATGGDREQGGFYIDADTSATGGDASDEHRLYGGWADVRMSAAADPDIMYGLYGYTEGQRSSGTPSTANVYGVYGLAVSDEIAGASITNLKGTYGYASLQDAGAVSNAIGVDAFTYVSANRSANLTNLRGMRSEVDIANNTGGNITISDVRVVEATLDHNNNSSDGSSTTAVVGSSYLYYGNAAITQANQVTNNWGLYINGETKNYFSGNVGIGTTGPDAKLHVDGGSILVDAFTEGAGAGLFFREGFLNTNQPSITVQDHSGANPDGLCISAYDGISWRLNAAEKMRLTGSNLGIGTTSPAAYLHVDSPTTMAPSLTFGATAGQILQTENSEFAFGLDNDSPYSLWIQGRNSGDAARNISLQPLGGYIGIGTEAPETLLHLDGKTGQIAQMGTGNSTYGLHFADDRGMVGHVGGAATLQGGNGGKFVRFCVNNATFGSGEVSRFDISGNMMIGTTAPIMGLADSIQLNVHNGTTRKRSILQLSSGSSTDADVLGSLWFSNSDNSDATNFDGGSKMVAAMEAYVETDDSNAGDDAGAHLGFITKPNAGTIVERMRITSDGNVGIGTDTPPDELTVEANEPVLSIYHNENVGSVAAGDVLSTISFRKHTGNSGNETIRIYNVQGDSGASGASDDYHTSDLRISTRLIGSSTYTDRFTILGQEGNIGIGTNAPAEKLHVAGDIRVNDNASIQANGSGYLQLGNTSGGDIRVFGDGSTSRIQAHGNHLYLQTNRDSDDIIFATNAGGTDSDSTVVEAMRIHGPDGYVGIGTTAPAESLHVVGPDSGPIAKFERSGQESVLISGNNGWGNIYTSDAVFGFGTGGSTGANSQMVISGSSVGIGETTPLGKLHVKSGDAGTISVPATTDELVLENSGSAGMSIYSPDANNATINFGSASDDDYFFMQGYYNSGAPFVRLSFEASEKFRFNDAGRMGINTTSPDGMLDIDEVDGAIPGLRVRRNDSSTSSPLISFIDDSTGSDSPALQIQQDGTQAAIKVVGGAITASGTEGWGAWERISFWERDYGTQAGSSSGLHLISDDGDFFNSVIMPYACKVRAIVIHYFGESLNNTSDSKWRMFHSGDAANVIFDTTIDPNNDMSQVASLTHYWYAASGLDHSIAQGVTVAMRRETGAYNVGSVKIDLYYTRDL